MARDPELPEGQSAGRGPPKGLSPPEDDAILDLRAEIDEALREHLVSRLQGPGDARLLPDDLSEGVLISALKLIAPDGKYPMDRGRFWQLLDRHCPFRPDYRTHAALADEIEDLFLAARSESFEDGFDSALSLGLQALVLKHGEAALEIVSGLILDERVSPDAAAEALRCLGEMENAGTREARRELLERGLDCSSHVARDGAVIGLSDLRDPRTIPALEAAAPREKYRLLRANMLALIEELKGISP